MKVRRFGKWKRYMSMFLAFLMVFTMNMPFTALASEDGDGNTGEEAVADVIAEESDDVESGEEIVDEGVTAPVREGEPSGTLNKFDGVTWTYDEAENTLIVTGEGYRQWASSGSPFDSLYDQYKFEKIKFVDCKISGDASYLFYQLNNVKEIDLAGLDTSGITNMYEMFAYCREVKQLNLGNFNTENVTNMSYMFDSCNGLTGLDLSKFNTSNVRNMRNMFAECSMKSLDLSSFDTSNVTDMSNMFSGNSNLVTLKFGDNFKTDSVSEMKGMFQNCSKLTSLDLSNFKIGSICEDMREMFYGCSNLINLDISGFDLEGKTIQVKDMLTKVPKLLTIKAPQKIGTVEIDLPGTYCDETLTTEYTKLSSANEGMTLVLKKEESGTFEKMPGITWTWDEASKTLTVTGESALKDLYNNSPFESLSYYGIKKIKFENCTITGDASDLFYQQSGIEEIDASGLDTTGVTKMGSMFNGCRSLKQITFGENFKTDNATIVYWMFAGCESLESLDLSGFDLTNAESLTSMFEQCDSLAALVVPGAMPEKGTAALPNSFLDENGKAYSHISTECAGKTLTRRATSNAKPIEVKWEGGVMKWKMGPDYKGEPNFAWECYRTSEGETQERKAGNGSGYFGKFIDDDGYYYTDHSSDMNEGGTYRFKVRAAKGDDWLWSDYAVKTYVLPAARLEKPVAASKDNKAALTFKAVKNAKAYLVYLCDEEGRSNSDYYDTTVGGGSRIAVEEIQEKLDSYDLGFEWADEEHTRVNVYLSEQLLNYMQSGKEYYWSVMAISEDIDTYANSEYARSAAFTYVNETPHFRITCGKTVTEYVDWDKTLAYMNEQNSSTNQYIVEYLNYEPVDFIRLEGLPKAAGSLTLKGLADGNNSIEYLIRAESGRETVSYPLIVENDTLLDDDLQYEDLTVQGSAAAHVNDKIIINNLTIKDNGGFHFGSTSSSGGGDLNGNILLKGKLTGTILIKGISQYMQIGDVLVTAGSFLTEDSLIFDSDLDYGVQLRENQDGTKSLLLAENSSDPNAKTYTVTFDYQGKGTNSTTTVKEGGKVIEPTASTVEGFTFGGWYKEAACTTAWNFDTDTVTKDTTLYAKWTENKTEEPVKPVDDEKTVSPAYKDDDYYGYKAEEKTDISTVATVSAIKAKVYDGSPYLPAVKLTGKDGKKSAIIEGADYVVLYENNINAGKGKAVAKGIGQYKGEVSTTFEIMQKELKKLKAVAGGVALNGKEIAVHVYDGGKELKEGTDYTLGSIDTSSAGKKTVTITAKEGSNYKGSTTAKVTVYSAEKVLKEGDVKLEYESTVYTGKALKPSVTVSYEGKTLEAKEYSVKYTNNKAAGTAYVTVTGKKGYAGSVVKTFEIKPISKKFELKGSIKEPTYNGKAQTPKLTIQVDGKTLKAGKDYVAFYSDNRHAGKATVKVKGLGNYAGAAEQAFQFVIKPQQIKKATVKGTKENLEISYVKRPLVKDKDYTVSFGEENNGKVEVTIKGMGDFAGSEATKKVKMN